MKIVYSHVTKTFSVEFSQFDPNNWERSFRQVMLDAEKQSIEESRFFSKSDKISLLVNIQTEIEYYIYDGFAKNKSWTYHYVPKGTKLYADLKQMSISALANIDKILKSLLTEMIPEGSHPYTKDKNYAGRYYFKLDNFNRFTFRPIIQYNKVYISSIMFHHEDKITEKGIVDLKMKRILYELFNEFIDDNLKSDLLNNRIEYLKSH